MPVEFANAFVILIVINRRYSHKAVEATATIRMQMEMKTMTITKILTKVTKMMTTLIQTMIAELPLRRCVRNKLDQQQMLVIR